MTKKHLLSIPVVFCVFICTMCTDAISPLLQKQKNNRFISLSEAKANVLDLLRIIDTKTTKGASNSRQIANCFSLGFGTKGSNGGLIYHVINFADNKGYALASADRRTMPVFCVIDEGQFSGFDKIDNPSFKAILKSIDIYYHLKTGAKVFDTNGNEVPKEVLVRRFGDVIDEEFDEDTIECFYPEGSYVEYQAWQPKERFGTILSTKWGQRHNFNKYCFTQSGASAPAGCAPVAIGQIMAFHQHNITYNGHVYNWSIMSNVIDTTSCPNDTVAWNAVAHLLADLGRPENLNVSYGIDGSGADFSLSPRSFLNFGYSHTGSHQDYDALSSLNNKLYYGPVLISGYAVDSLAIINMAHTWIIDEEVTRRRRVRYNYQSTDYTEVYQEDRVIHMNIGAYGYANGYYYPDYLNIGMGPINFRNDSLILNTNLDIEMNTFLEYYYDIY